MLIWYFQSIFFNVSIVIFLIKVEHSLLNQSQEKSVWKKQQHIQTSDNYKNMLKLWLEIWYERLGFRLLKHNSNNIIANISFSWQLLSIVWSVGQQCRYVKHQFVALLLSIHTVESSRVICEKINKVII